MRGSMFLLLLAGCAFAQTPKAPPATKAAETANVSPETAVITIKGLCDAAKTGKPDCQTVISKAQFEKLVEVLQPGMTPPMRRQLAMNYGRLIYLSEEAEKRGLDKGPAFEESMRFKRMQALAEQLGKSLQEQADKISDSDLQQYYKDNQAAYEEAEVLRIFVPRDKSSEPPKDGKPPDAADEKAGEEAMKKEADLLRGRAAGGEDFDKLQKEAFTAAGVSAAPPNANLGKVRRMGLPPEHAPVFELKAGEVSQVISDASGHFIYKVVSKQQMPFEQVKEEIHQTMQSQRLKDAQQEVLTKFTPELNDAYFGSTPTRPKPQSKDRQETTKPAMPPK